jgi:hypothetical protein
MIEEVQTINPGVLCYLLYAPPQRYYYIILLPPSFAKSLFRLPVAGWYSRCRTHASVIDLMLCSRSYTVLYCPSRVSCCRAAAVPLPWYCCTPDTLYNDWYVVHGRVYSTTYCCRCRCQTATRGRYSTTVPTARVPKRVYTQTPSSQERKFSLGGVTWLGVPTHTRYHAAAKKVGRRRCIVVPACTYVPAHPIPYQYTTWMLAHRAPMPKKRGARRVSCSRQPGGDL